MPDIGYLLMKTWNVVNYDLVCVLFLSGMQKEDLDLSMLIKLRRYNVNIEDINNGQMKKDCITQDVSRTEKSITENSETMENNTRIRETTKAIQQIEEIINKQHDNNEKVSSRIDLNISNMPVMRRNYTNIKYTKGQPNLESVMKFWDSYATSSGIRTKDTSTETHKINTRRVIEYTNRNSETNAKQSEIINKILKELNILNKDVETGAPIKITRNVDVEARDMNFDYIKIRNNDEQERHINKYPMTVRPKTYGDQILNKPEGNEESSKNLSMQNLTDILHMLGQYSNKKEYREKSTELVNKHEPQLYSDPLQSTFVENSYSHNVKNKSNTNQFVTGDLVKKIAESVKDMVLQELRKEFKSTTSTTPKAETISHTQTNLNGENIMEKFIKMFENIISQQEHSTTLPRINKKMGNVNIEQRIIKIPQYPSIPADVIVYTRLPYDLQPQIHKYKSDTHNYLNDKKPMSKPITFQTNSLEIPPLGIPITHHQYPINQNIIVTTKAPFQAMRYESDNGHVYSDSNSVKLYPKEILQSPLSAKFVKRSDDCPLHHACNHKNEDIIRFRLSNKGSAKYDTDYYEKINLGKFEPNFGTNKNDYGTASVPKFHEKLEKADGSDIFSDVANDDCCNSKYGMTQQMVDCCNEKIASRQQVSIANMKRGPHDDTHFRNFLKTQQKVTDMLEKILASRVKPELPRSVETT